MNKIFGLLLLSGVIGTAAYSELPQQKQSESPIRYIETEMAEPVYATPASAFRPLEGKPDFAFPAHAESPVYETEIVPDNVTISNQWDCSGGVCRPVTRSNRVFRRR